MTVRRFTPYPPRSVDRARFGFVINGSLGVAAARTQFLAAGAKMARWQPGWETVESYATGVLALPAADAAELAWCAANGIAPVLVAAYGPPYSPIATLTLAANAPIGSTTLTVTTSVASIDPPFCHVTKHDGTQLTPEGKWSYPGSLIHAVNPATKVLTLAAATSVALVAGDQIDVQRLRYASLPDQDPTNPGVVAYLRYAKFLADRIHAAGCPEGWVCLWNEVAWTHDQWNDRSAFYDTPPVTLVSNSRLSSILTAAMAVTDLPAGVRFINGASDNSGFSSVVAGIQDAHLLSAAQVRDSIAAEGQHPYGNNPEAHAWDPISADEDYGVDWYQALNPAVELGSNFRYQAKVLRDFADAHGGVAPELIATECGADLGDDTYHAIKLLRRVISLWGVDVTPVVYALAADNGNYPVINATTYAPRAAVSALGRLATRVGLIGSAGGSALLLPTVVGCPDSRYPLMIVSLYGAAGGLSLCWQRTWVSTGNWASLVRPVPALPVSFHLPGSASVVEATDLLTGAAVPVAPVARVFTLDVTDTPIAVRTA